MRFNNQHGSRRAIIPFYLLLIVSTCVALLVFLHLNIAYSSAGNHAGTDEHRLGISKSALQSSNHGRLRNVADIEFSSSVNFETVKDPSEHQTTEQDYIEGKSITTMPPDHDSDSISSTTNQIILDEFSSNNSVPMEVSKLIEYPTVVANRSSAPSGSPTVIKTYMVISASNTTTSIQLDEILFNTNLVNSSSELEHGNPIVGVSSLPNISAFPPVRHIYVNSSSEKCLFSRLRIFHHDWHHDLNPENIESFEVYSIEHNNAVPNSNLFGSSSKYGKSDSKMDAASKNNSDILERFHRALREGTPCIEAKETDTNSAIKPLILSLQALIDTSKPKLFIEYSFIPTKVNQRPSTSSISEISRELSKSNRYLTVLSLEVTDSIPFKANEMEFPTGSSSCKAIESEVSTNRYIARGNSASIDPFPGLYDCAQTVPDLVGLTDQHQLLPSEFEEKLGRILCRCNYTFVSKTIPDSSYFTYWDSISSLLKAASLSASQLCDVSFESSVYSSSDFTSHVRYTHIVVRRNDSAYSLGIYGPRSNYLKVDTLFSLPLIRRSVETLGAAVIAYLSTKSTSTLQEIGLRNSSFEPPYYNLDQLEAAMDFSEIRLKTWMSSLLIRGSKLLNVSEADDIDMKLAMQSVPTSSTTSSTGSYVSSYSWRKPVRKYSTSSDTQNISVESNMSTSRPTTSPFSSSSRSRRLSASSYSSYSKSIKDSSSNDGLLYKDGAVLSWMLSNQTFSAYGDNVDKQIQVKINKLSMKGSRKKELVTESRSSEEKVVFGTDVRTLQQEMHDRESLSYQHWMNRLSKSNQLRSIKNSKIVYIFGNEISLLSIKIATLFPSTVVVSVLGSRVSMQSHMSLVSLMAIRNNIIAHHKLSIEKLAALLIAPERADHSIIHIDWVLRLILLALEKVSTTAETFSGKQEESLGIPAMCGVDIFEESMAAILLLSNVTYLELPSPVTLRVLLQNMVPNCADYIGSRYISRISILEKAVQYMSFGVHATISELQDATGNDEDLRSSRLFRVQISFQSTSSSTPSDSNIETGHDCRNASYFYQNRRSDFGVSLYSLLHLGIIATQKKQLLEMLVSLPIWYLSQLHSTVTDDLDSILPWNLFLQLDTSSSKRKWSFSYLPHDDYGCLVAPSLVGVKSESENADLDRLQGLSTWQVIEKELSSHEADLANGRFSFVEHNSGYGYLSTRIAKKYPNATVISLEKDSFKIAHHLKIIKTLGVRNNALCRKTVEDTTIYKNIYESPELLRFQYVPQSILKDFLSSASIEEWGQTVGQILSIALTTFAYIPRASQVSWAMHMIFGEVYSSKQSDLGDDDEAGNELKRFRYYLDAPYRSLGDIFRAETSRCHIRDDFESENQLESKLHLVKHPQQVYVGFEESWLLKIARTLDDGNTSILLTPMQSPESRSRNSQALWPFARCDIMNMTRKVHHHYDYKKDGHKRTYTMEIRVNDTLTQEIQSYLEVTDVSSVHSFENVNGNIILSRQQDIADSEGKFLIDQVHSRYEYLHPFMARNQNGTSSSDGRPDDASREVHEVNMSEESPRENQFMNKYANDKFVQLPAGCHPNQHYIVSVSLYREKDDWPIPYNSIYGVTLITLLRLGLDDSLRERFFSSFMQLPLYEDMAPWNIVLMGSALQYIDYDTKDITFDKEVSKAYMIMTVLMNYKRTVEDFKRCGSKASTVYNLPYVSDCVGTYVDKALTCPSLSLPVPCPDGECHTSYISCLKSMSTELDGLTELQNLITSTRKSNSNSKSAVLSDEIPGDSEMKSILGSFSEKTYMKNIFKMF